MATIYINADTGNDSTGTGTSALPYETLAKALTVTTIGDTIYCQSATNKYTLASATISGRTLQGQSVDTVVFEAANLSAVTWTAVNQTGTIINDITFTNSYFIIRMLSNNAISNLFVNRCKFKTIYCGGSGGSLFTSGDSISTNDVSTSTVSNCTFDDIKNNSGSNGVLISNRRTRVKHKLINCTIYFSDASNVLYRIAGSSLTSMDCEFYNTIVSNDTGQTLIFSDIDTTNSIYVNSHSCWHNITDQSGIPYTAGVNRTVTNILQVDPEMVNPSTGDFRLRQSSPCLDTGVII